MGPRSVQFLGRDSAPSHQPVGRQVPPRLSWEADIFGDTPSSPSHCAPHFLGLRQLPYISLLETIGFRKPPHSGPPPQADGRALLCVRLSTGFGGAPSLGTLSAAHSGSKALITIGNFQCIAQIVLLGSLLTGPPSRWLQNQGSCCLPGGGYFESGDYSSSGQNDKRDSWPQ